MGGSPQSSQLLEALGQHHIVAVEVTGAWDSDYKLAEDMERQGHNVLRLWITASFAETAHRLQARTTSKVAVTSDEAEAIYERATRRAAQERWDATLDTSGNADPEAATAVLRRLLGSN